MRFWQFLLWVRQMGVLLTMTIGAMRLNDLDPATHVDERREAAWAAAAAPPSLVLRQVTQPGVTLPDVVLAPGHSVVLGRDAHGLPKTGEFKKISKEQCRVTMGAAAPWRVMVERLGLASTRVGTDEVLQLRGLQMQRVLGHA